MACEVPADMLIFVNVHGLELTDEDLFDDGCALAPFASRIVLEITERMGLDALTGPTRVAMLRQRGYRIAVDDLGAGYAALGAIATLEPEIVKLDMSLIRDIDRHPTKKRVVGAMATLCRELGARVVAEGVETVEQQTFLRDHGCDEMQGFIFSRPVPARDLAELLRAPAELASPPLQPDDDTDPDLSGLKRTVV
jgi:EAL domain-containing protein (putative c-di-GMP-specific phosphodiesterase class I)